MVARYLEMAKETRGDAEKRAGLALPDFAGSPRNRRRGVGGASGRPAATKATEATKALGLGHRWARSRPRRRSRR